MLCTHIQVLHIGCEPCTLPACNRKPILFYNFQYKEENISKAHAHKKDKKKTQTTAMKSFVPTTNNMVVSRSHAGQLPNTGNRVFYALYAVTILSKRLTFNCPFQAPRPSCHPFLEGACLQQCFCQITWLHQLFAYLVFNKPLPLTNIV